MVKALTRWPILTAKWVMGNKLLPVIRFIKPSDKDKILRRYNDLNSGYRCAMKNLKESFRLKRSIEALAREALQLLEQEGVAVKPHDEELARSH
jgi:hypothetical protein